MLATLLYELGRSGDLLKAKIRYAEGGAEGSWQEATLTGADAVGIALDGAGPMFVPWSAIRQIELIRET